MTLITIAIPTYNNESTIKRTIDSCLNQTDLDGVEIIVINNASQDRTSEILIGYEKKINVITNEVTVSLFENHNVALRNSKAEYILFCHSDDILYPDAIQTIKRKLSERGFPKKYICWGHSMFRDFYPSLLNSNFSTGQVFSGMFATHPFLFGGLTPSGTCYSKEFLQIGGFLPTQHRLGPSDATSMVNAALQGFGFEMIGSIIFQRESASTLTSSTRKAEYLLGYENAFINLFSMLEKKAVEGIIESTYFMKGMPIAFLSVASQVSSQKSMKQLLRGALKRPKYFLNLEFYKAVVVLLKKIIDAR